MWLGAILYQNQDGVYYITGYTSRSLSKTKHKCLAHKLEFLALKWANMEQFHKYLYGNNFLVYTGNNPLTYILNSTKLDATGHHWVTSLANYYFAVNYQSGKINMDVYALSCIPKGEHDQHMEANLIHTLISQLAQGTTLMEAYSCIIQVTETLDMQKDLYVMSVKDWVIAQSKDPAIREIKYLINNKAERAEGVLTGLTNY